ncbi:hypothetical protein ACWDRX_05895, partial [Streptomyces nigra]
MPPFDLPEGDPFGAHNLPYGVFSLPGPDSARRVGVRLGDHVLDAGRAAEALDPGPDLSSDEEAALLRMCTV